jgi:hypothetical protein
MIKIDFDRVNDERQIYEPGYIVSSFTPIYLIRIKHLKRWIIKNDKKTKAKQ